MWWEDRLFGYDMRHREPPQIMPTSRERIIIQQKRNFHFSNKKIEKLVSLFGITSYKPKFFDSYKAWRYGVKTKHFGRIEVDVFQENILLLPSDNYYQYIEHLLTKAGIMFEIVGDNRFINIKKI